MENNKSEVDKFLEGTNDDQTFKETSEDPFAKQTAETKEEEEKVKPLPFNKDPKVQKFIEKEISKRLTNIKVEAPRETTPREDDETTDVLTRLIGNDTAEKVSMIKEFKNILEKGTQRARDEAIYELESRQQAEVEADIEAEQELEYAFDNIEETYDVDITSNNPLARKTRQEFVSFVEKIAPKDRNGDIVDYPDMVQAFETFSEIKKSTATPSRAKELASRSMTRSSEVQNKPQDRMNWNKVDEFMDSLKS